MPRSLRSRFRLAALAFLTACAADRPLSPAIVRDALLNVVPPAKAYTATVPAGLSGYLADVNDNLLVAGSDGTDGFVYDARAGAVSILPRRGWVRSGAHAINAGGAVGGFVTDAQATDFPSVWPSPTTRPRVAPDPGWVTGLNDLMIAVGSHRPRQTPGVIRAFAWNLKIGSFTELPVPKGTINSFAEDINNDGVIIGSVDAWGPVLWKPAGTGYSLTLLRGFSTVSAIDGGYGVVGTMGTPGVNSQAAFGSPHATSFFLGPVSAAYDVNGWGIAVGTSTTTAGIYLPWIGDRNRTITWLPHPTAAPGTASAHAVAVNNCGFAVGISLVSGVYVPTTWDPGC